MNEQREAKIRKVAQQRQPNLAVILENIADTHNVGAVMRTCDSVGIQELFLLYSDPNLARQQVVLGKRTSAGTRRWLEIHLYTDVEACFEAVRKKYQFIFSTHLAADSVSVYDLDLTQSVVLLFGSEKNGVSNIALAHCDGNFTIPQVGMAQSLNISVACAVSLYEAYRQRQAKGFYDIALPATQAEQETLFESYKKRSELHEKRRKVKKIM